MHVFRHVHAYVSARGNAHVCAGVQVPLPVHTQRSKVGIGFLVAGVTKAYGKTGLSRDCWIYTLVLTMRAISPAPMHTLFTLKSYCPCTAVRS